VTRPSQSELYRDSAELAPSQDRFGRF